MKRRRWISVLGVLLMLAGFGTAADVQAQGRGRGSEKQDQQSQAKDAKPQQKGRAQAQRQEEQPRQDGAQRQNDKPANPAARGQSKFKRDVAMNDVRPDVRRFAASKRAPERLAAGAVSRAFARGVKDDELSITSASDRVHIRNRAGVLLLDMDDDRARNLGHWNVVPIGTNVSSGAPAFCGSGAGHPVWGRQWCIDKGFGLGRYRDVNWGRTTSISDIIFGRPIVDRETLLRDALVSTVGNVVLDRLGLHALTLGYTEPLSGVWVAQPTGAQVLLVNSGTYPVAEVVDLDRDNRADMMVFALRPW